MVVDSHGYFGDNIAGPCGDDLRTQDLAVGPVNDLDEPVAVVVGDRTIESLERPARNTHIVLSRGTSSSG
jgi:hypothetical protein